MVVPVVKVEEEVPKISLYVDMSNDISQIYPKNSKFTKTFHKLYITLCLDLFSWNL